MKKRIKSVAAVAGWILVIGVLIVASLLLHSGMTALTDWVRSWFGLAPSVYVVQ